jgi:hypothetical protein
MSLPKEIEVIFFETLYGDRTVLEFEQWLYANRELEHILNEEDYLELISYGYKGKSAAYGLYTLLEKHIHKSEYKLYKLMRQKYPRLQESRGTPIKTPFDEQLQRITDKLTIARNVDAKFGVFGSETHEYLLNIPVTEEEVLLFESRYAVQLPLCYRSFLLKVGNGGIGYNDAGAGPDYGIYPLGHGVNDLIRNNGENYLNNDCQIDPDMTMDRWNFLKELPRTHRNYEREWGKFFGGLLPVGSQGCTYLNGIVLNGPYKGCMVILDFGRILPPVFTHESNFLDWYEKWLDQVINRTHR